MITNIDETVKKIKNWCSDEIREIASSGLSLSRKNCETEVVFSKAISKLKRLLSQPGLSMAERELIESAIRELKRKRDSRFAHYLKTMEEDGGPSM